MDPLGNCPCQVVYVPEYEAETMRKLLCIYPLYLFLLSCHIAEKKDKPNQSEQNELLVCGKYISKVYPRDHRTETYADLGMLLNEDDLELTENQKAIISKFAVNCALQCKLDKERIDREVQFLHQKLTESEYLNGNLTRLSYQLNKIELQKQKWLAKHEIRYTSGINLLTDRQLQQWNEIIKDQVIPFP